jgi:hypothetical protein
MKNMTKMTNKTNSFSTFDIIEVSLNYVLSETKGL